MAEPSIIKVLRSKAKQDRGMVLVGPRVTVLGVRGKILDDRDREHKVFSLSAAQVKKAVKNYDKEISARRSQ